MFNPKQRRFGSGCAIVRAAGWTAGAAMLAAAMWPSRALAADRYWDGGDADASNNNASTGAGLGGDGMWSGSLPNWWDGASATDQAWNNGAGDVAVFWGPTAANLTLGSAVTVSGLNFKTSGYGVIGAQELTLGGAATMNVDTGNATFSSIVVGNSGLTKTGAGVLILNNINNTYTGGTIVNGGTLAITREGVYTGIDSTSKAPLGTVPPNNLTGPGPGYGGVLLNGATLRIDYDQFNPGPPTPATFGPTRRIDLGAAGGTFEVGTDPVGNPLNFVLGADGGGAQASGGVYTSAGGHLTKTGPGRVAVSKNTASSSTIGLSSYVGLTIKQGVWAIYQTDTTGNPVGAQPPASPPNATEARKYALVLDYNGLGGGAIFRFRGTSDGIARTDITLNNNRPILIGAGGGTIDTNGSATSHGGFGGVSNSGAFSGILALGAPGTGTLIKAGDGEFYHAGDASYGSLIINRGSWAVANESQLGLGSSASPAINVTLDSNTISGQLATLRINQANVVMAASHTLTIGAGGGVICTDGAGDVWNGPLVGSGTLTKAGYTGLVISPFIGNSTGSGTLMLNTDSPGFSGAIVVNTGALIAASALKLGDDVSAGNTLTLNSGGTFRPAASFAMNRGVTIGASGGTIDTQANNLNVLGGIDGSGTLTKIGAGTLMVKRVRSGGLAVNAGTVQVNPDGGSAGASIVNTLSISGVTDTWAAQLDLTNNDVILRSSGAARQADVDRITNQLKQGLNATTNSNQALFWTGNGIVTSSGWKGGSNYTGIGVTYNDKAAAGLPSAPLYTSFDGQTVGVNDVLVKYTWFGDADLDGAVTSNDYFQIDTGFLGNKTGWINGDFDYNGVINTNDYFLIDSAFLAQGSTVLAPAAPADVVAVPEPGAVGIIVMGMMWGLRSRKRRVTD